MFDRSILSSSCRLGGFHRRNHRARPLLRICWVLVNGVSNGKEYNWNRLPDEHPLQEQTVPSSAGIFSFVLWDEFLAFFVTIHHQFRKYGPVATSRLPDAWQCHVTRYTGSNGSLVQIQTWGTPGQKQKTRTGALWFLDRRRVKSRCTTNEYMSTPPIGFCLPSTAWPF